MTSFVEPAIVFGGIATIIFSAIITKIMLA